MLRNYYIPKRLKTVILPKKRILLWINEKKIENLNDVSSYERHFVKDFIQNLTELDWTVLIENSP